VEQIGERRDTTLTAFIAGGERAIGFVEIPIRPSFRNEGAAAVWKRTRSGRPLKSARSCAARGFTPALSDWRRQRAAGAFEALSPAK
jgi:hypothetical protein